MKQILAFVRREAVVIAGLVTAVLSFVVTNDNVIAAIIPLAVSLITRTQVAPLAKLEELLRLIAELKTKPPASHTTSSTPVAIIPVKPRPPQ